MVQYFSFLYCNPQHNLINKTYTGTYLMIYHVLHWYKHSSNRMSMIFHTTVFHIYYIDLENK